MTPRELRDLVDLAAALGGDLVVDFTGDALVDVAGDDYFKLSTALFVGDNRGWMHYSQRPAAMMRNPRIAVGQEVFTITEARAKLVDHAG